MARRASSVGPVPVWAEDAVPWLSVEEMRRVDEIAVGELGLELKQLMENAGRNLAVLARMLLGGAAAGRRVSVLAGPGGNGGGGLAAARHLLGAGASVRVFLATAPERLAPVTRDQLAILTAAGADVRVGPDRELVAADLVVDAVLGYAQSGAPRADAAGLIAAAASARVLALDVPSGLELATGKLHEPHVRAEATMTLAVPKTGLRAAGASASVGDLYLADISVPAAVFERLAVRYASPFSQGPLVRLDRGVGSPS